MTGARGRCISVAGLVALALAGAERAQADSPEDAVRYPYDPVCSWGRISDGKGLLVRCLTQSEATGLAGGQRPKVAPAAVKPQPPTPESPPSASSSPSAEAPPEPAPSRQALAIEVGPVLVDSGALPLAQKKLSVPTERYLQCVADNGGLTEHTGEVRVRFLVRERGRAEGASISKRAGVSEAAAKCLADVVDRRFVGYPDAPLVGATLVLKVRRP